MPHTICYPMPGPQELPANTAQWRLEPGRAALLVHDMQEYFLRPLARGGAPYEALVDNAARLRDACVAHEIPVAYTAQPGGMTVPQRGLLRSFWGAGMSTDPSDREVVPALAPAAADRRFVKWRYSAFHASELEQWLRSLGRDQLIVCGVYAHVGVLMTAADAYSRDIETFLVADAVADFSREDHDVSLEYAAARCAVVQSTTDVISDLASEPLFDESVNLLHGR